MRLIIKYFAFFSAINIVLIHFEGLQEHFMNNGNTVLKQNIEIKTD